MRCFDAESRARARAKQSNPAATIPGRIGLINPGDTDLHLRPVRLSVRGNPSRSRVTLTHALERMPLYFIENRGQMDPRVAYYVQGRDTTLYFTAGALMSPIIKPKLTRKS